MKLLYTIPRNGDMLSTFQPPPRGFMPETNGQKLERFLSRAGMQQKELAAKLSVEASYISRMVNDRIGWVNGRYFGQIASILRLTDDEIRELNPAAVVTIEPNISPVSAPAKSRSRLRPLPPELEEMIAEKSKFDSDLETERWQQYLAGQRFASGSVSAERWWSLYLVLKNAGVEPGGN